MKDVKPALPLLADQIAAGRLTNANAVTIPLPIQSQFVR
jgi:hypothetical protein